MRIAILGATSQIARDLITSFAAHKEDIRLHLFARRPDAVQQWLLSSRLSGYCPVDDIPALNEYEFDAIINFAGVGNDPKSALEAGSSIFDTTLRIDEMALDYLREHPGCRYLFMSSGAAYGSTFNEPANRDTPAVVPINNLTAQDWYGVAKLHAECRHRSLADFSIIDIRVFNYFSHTLNMSARFLITDILRAIRSKEVLRVSPGYIVRDYLHPSDFHGLIDALLSAPAANAAIDCYSREPIDKPTLLATMQKKFGLRYEIAEEASSVNATGSKPYYYSLNTRAADFGYCPSRTSLEGVLLESEILLSAFPN